MRSTGQPGHQGRAGAAAACAAPVDAPDLPAGRGSRTSVLTAAACAPIRLYRALTVALPPHCRFWPSCSAYALESVEVHGVGRGLVLAARRISRCHPWGGFGADPVPLPRTRDRVTV